MRRTSPAPSGSSPRHDVSHVPGQRAGERDRSGTFEVAGPDEALGLYGARRDHGRNRPPAAQGDARDAADGRA